MAKGVLVIIAAGLIFLLFALPEADSEVSTYVGSKVCRDCHEQEYINFSKYAKKAHSERSVKIMSHKLTKEELETCFSCHTTGFGKPGGFKSYTQTPDLAHAGCEVCHGPGSLHVDSGGDPSLIKGSLSLQDCETCHSQERIKSFNFKPLLYGGAH
jgi:hypothetical protein